MSINLSAFPSILKLADVILAHKKGLRQQKNNCQYPSQSTENLWIYNLQTIRTNLFSKYQNGFRNGFHSENCLVVIKEKVQKLFRSCVTYRSDKSIWLPTTWINECKITRLRCQYATFKTYVKLFAGRYHRVNINNSFFLWTLIKYGVPQRCDFKP